jgi:hypothetical protein
MRIRISETAKVSLKEIVDFLKAKTDQIIIKLFRHCKQDLIKLKYLLTK